MNADPKKNQELLEAAADFLECFEGVFDYDWDFTKGVMSDEWQRYYIRENGTFLNPKVDDESNNWANRGGLLTTYRRFATLMREANKAEAAA